MNSEISLGFEEVLGLDLFILVSLGMWFAPPLGALSILWLFPYLERSVKTGSYLAVPLIVFSIIAVLAGINVFRVVCNDQEKEISQIVHCN